MRDLHRLTADKRRPTLAAIGAATHDVVSAAELRLAGLSGDQIAHLAAIGFLHLVHRGVYAVGRPRLSFEGRCRAACLACGPGSAVSHISAARAHGFRSSTGRVHVSAPRQRRTQAGLIVHRPRSLTLDDIEEREGFAVTTVARTILDMAPGESAETVGKWIHEADVQRVLDCREVWSLLERQQHHRGARIVEAALALEVLDTRTGLEEALFAIWRGAGMPAAVANEWVWTEKGLEEVDLYCSSLELVIEADGGRYHASRWRRRRDAAKDARVRATGKEVWRVPELAITLDPAGVAAEMRRIAAARA
jgi:predicted transcriptional regulator of viral defense system